MTYYWWTVIDRPITILLSDGDYFEVNHSELMKTSEKYSWNIFKSFNSSHGCISKSLFRHYIFDLIDVAYSELFSKRRKYWGRKKIAGILFSPHFLGYKILPFFVLNFVITKKHCILHQEKLEPKSTSCTEVFPPSSTRDLEQIFWDRSHSFLCLKKKCQPSLCQSNRIRGAQQFLCSCDRLLIKLNLTGYVIKSNK